MPERPGEPNKLLVMVLMMMGVPPCSMVGRYDGHACCSYLAGISLEVNLLGPPLGWLLSLGEILGEGGEEGIGQNDHFVMV
jgi:hypothetical protein